MNIKFFKAYYCSVLLAAYSCLDATENGFMVDNVFIDQSCNCDNFVLEEEALCITRAPGGQKLIDYVKNKYEVTVVGRQCLFYPAKNAKRLVISFGYGGVGNVNYFLWSWFWRDDEAWDGTAYLFVRDLDDTWYFGNKKKPCIEDYSSIINHFIQLTKVSKEHVFAVGLSMGGTAAVFYSVLLKLRGALAINPVLDKEVCTLANCPERWPGLIAKSYWQNVFELIKKSEALPSIALLIGTEKFDELSAYSLIETLKRQHSDVILHHANLRDHGIFKPLNIAKAFIDNEIAYLDQPRNSANALNEIESIV